MKQIFLFIINWFFILTLPIWGGIAILVVMLASVIDDSFTQKVMKGQKFIFEDGV
jgi:hypothetical protein